MTTLPEEAVKAAINAWFEETRPHVMNTTPLPEQARRMRLAIKAALPFLQRVEALDEAAKIADELEERTKLKYASPDGEECQIVPLTVIIEAAKALRALPFLPVQGAVNIDEIVQPLEDIHAPGGLCRWTDVATAIGEVRRTLSALEPSAARELAFYEGDDICARLEGLASWLDGSQHSKWCGRKEVPIHGYSGEGKLVRAAIAAIRALSYPDHADAGKVEGDGWSMSPPKFHRYPYFVENISGKWCLCKHHGNGASHTISVHETAREARDAAPSEGA